MTPAEAREKIQELRKRVEALADAAEQFQQSEEVKAEERLAYLLCLAQVVREFRDGLAALERLIRHIEAMGGTEANLDADSGLQG